MEPLEDFEEVTSAPLSRPHSTTSSEQWVVSSCLLAREPTFPGRRNMPHNLIMLLFYGSQGPVDRGPNPNTGRERLICKAYEGAFIRFLLGAFFWGSDSFFWGPKDMFSAPSQSPAEWP